MTTMGERRPSEAPAAAADASYSSSSSSPLRASETTTTRISDAPPTPVQTQQQQHPRVSTAATPPNCLRVTIDQPHTARSAADDTPPAIARRRSSTTSRRNTSTTNNNNSLFIASDDLATPERGDGRMSSTSRRNHKSPGGMLFGSTFSVNRAELVELEATEDEERRRIYVNICPQDLCDRDKASTPNLPSATSVIGGKKASPGADYPANKIRTSKYTIWSFLPKNLFEQFRSVANFYFTSLVILQIFPPFAEVSVTLTSAPVILIIGVTAIKDAFEDYKRHKSDDSVNRSRTYLLKPWQNMNFAAFKAGGGLTGADLDPNSNASEGVKPRKFKFSFFEWMWPAAPDPEFPEYIGGEPIVQTGNGDAPSASDEPLWKLSRWEDVRVGDFIYLRNNDSIPADVAIISSSEPEAICYVETKNLDGETNLKVRRGVPFLSHVRTPKDCKNLHCFIDSEPPNTNLYAFSGTITARSPSSLSSPSEEKDRTAAIGPNGILLRGCVLRNTKWVVGVVLFTGVETKIMLNSGITPSKRSRIERQLNPLVMLNFMILVAMCIICALIAAVYAGTFLWEGAPFTDAAKGHDVYSPSYAAFVSFFTCMIIFQNVIPIALYISVDISKTVQSFFISMDEDMYDKEMDKHAAPQSWNLVDDLGQIEYIFSDKTGTLTCNSMEFRKCSINGVVYGGNFVTEAMQGAAEREGARLNSKEMERSRAEQEALMRENMAKLFDLKYVSGKFSFVDSNLPLDLGANSQQGTYIRYFFSLLAICHTVLAERPKPGVALRGDVVEYKAQSPDEAALVSAARDVGFAFLGRKDDVVEISILGEERAYSVLNVLEFNSDRKRMSVLVRLPEGFIVLLVKGADNVILERLGDSSVDQMVGDQVHIPAGAPVEVTQSHLAQFADEGLRTLCLAYRIIPEDEYQAWNKKYVTAQNSIRDRDKKVDAVAELIEHNLTLMGATAIEDRLQDGVPETVGTLAKAGIKIWVLTGDKLETAINIGFASNLLKRDMTIIILQSTTQADTMEKLLDALERFWTPEGLVKEGNSHALVIDGNCLKHALHPDCKPYLLELGCRCKAVVCCRVSPLQKAKVVQLVRKGLGAMCLAIGDGANDVSMIQEADVGIGIIGKEGLQAVMASDYAIAQFRFLGKLLLVHGRWGYLRTAELILNYFYKNMVWLFLLFWYQFDCGFSAQIITDFTYGMFFNTLFTLLPTFYEGMFDQDVNEKLSMMVPQLYGKGIKQVLFTMERFWLYTSEALYQSVVIYYFCILASSGGSQSRNGYDTYLDSIGTTMGFAAIITVNLYNGINTYYWTWLTVVGFIVTFGIWSGYVVLYASGIDSPTYGQAQVLMRELQFYLTILLCVAVALGPRLIRKFMQQYLWPTDTDIICEVQKYSWKDGGEDINTELKDPEVARDGCGSKDGEEPPSPDAPVPVVASKQSAESDSAGAMADLEIVKDPNAIQLKRVNSDSCMQRDSISRLSIHRQESQKLRRSRSAGSFKNIDTKPPNEEEAAPKSATMQSDSSTSPASTESSLRAFIQGKFKLPLNDVVPSRGPFMFGRKGSVPMSVKSTATSKNTTTADGFIPGVLERRYSTGGQPFDQPAFLSLDPYRRGSENSSENRGRRGSFLTKAGGIFNRAASPASVLKLRIPGGAASSTRSARDGQSLKSPNSKISMVFMSTQEELPNLGFCFSHDGGMADVITPHNARPSVHYEQGPDYNDVYGGDDDEIDNVEA